MPLMHSHHINGEPIQRELAEKLVVQQQNGRHDEDLEFHDLPPFPDNVATAPLLRISLRKLQQRDPDEIERLWRACCDLGFFYLDSRNGADELLGTVEDMFKLGEGVFDLDEGEKEEFAMGKGTYFGYKGFGKDGADGNRNEFWNISKDDIFGISERLPNPPILNNEKSRALIKEYMLQSHGLVTLLLRLLNDKLALPPNTLESLHRLQAVSGDQVRWVKSPPQPPHDLKQALGAHTDFGSITILFNRLGGLQIHNEEEWKYVKPLRGHCIVNLGDAMVKFTAGVVEEQLASGC